MPFNLLSDRRTSIRADAGTRGVTASAYIVPFISARKSCRVLPIDAPNSINAHSPTRQMTKYFKYPVPLVNGQSAASNALNATTVTTSATGWSGIGDTVY